MTPQSDRIRIGTVPYLNVEPLIWALDGWRDRVELVAGTPRELADLLAEGGVDVGLVPVAEVLRTGRWSVVPGVSIACDGPIRSCIMISKAPWPEVRSILLDRSSMTSVLLGQLLLREVYHIAPVGTLSPSPLKATHPFKDDPHDAFIYIGNEALRLPLDALPHRIDLGEDWKTLTGLPFVFAVWAHAVDPKKEAAETRSDEIARILTEAALRGLQNLSTVCRAGAKRHHLPLELVQSYLTGAIRYGLGPHEQQAVAEFGRRLVNHGLLSAAHPLRIAEPHAVDTQRGT